MNKTAKKQMNVDELTELEKQALMAMVCDRVFDLHMDNCTDATLKFHKDLRNKLNRLLFPEDYN